MMKGAAMVRYSLIAKGTVQGVGFRFHCQRIALDLGITGWVQNLFDGSVQIEIQGTQVQTEQFISKIKERNFMIEVTQLTKTSIPIVEGEKKFRVIY